MKYFHLLLLSLLVTLSACTTPSQDTADSPAIVTGKTFINQKNGYSESVSITNGNIKTIYVSGQIGDGDDLDSQMRSVLANLDKALKSAGAEMTDIVKMNTYIVDYQAEMLDTFRSIRKEIMGDEKMPASTLVGVTSLAREEWLIEIDAVAVVIE